MKAGKKNTGKTKAKPVEKDTSRPPDRLINPVKTANTHTGGHRDSNVVGPPPVTNATKKAPGGKKKKK